jgi:hypothetical protein
LKRICEPSGDQMGSLSVAGSDVTCDVVSPLVRSMTQMFRFGDHPVAMDTATRCSFGLRLRLVYAPASPTTRSGLPVRSIQVKRDRGSAPPLK